MRSNSRSIDAVFGTDEGNFGQHKIIMTCSELPLTAYCIAFPLVESIKVIIFNLEALITFFVAWYTTI